MGANGIKANGKNPIQKPKLGVGRNPTLIPGNPGNRGGRKGRSGRKPDEWKAFCQAALSDPKVREAIRMAVRDPETRGYPNLLKLLASYAEGVPAQQIKVTGDQANPVRFTLALGEFPLDGD